MGLKNTQSKLTGIESLIKGGKRVRGKHSPISFLINGTPTPLKIKNLYMLSTKFKYFSIFQLKNYLKTPKLRTFLAITLASQSSDLLVSVAKNLITPGKALKLIQYSVFPSTLRINLLLLIELEDNQVLNESIELLNHIRQEFRKKLDKINFIMQNE